MAVVLKASSRSLGNSSKRRGIASRWILRDGTGQPWHQTGNLRSRLDAARKAAEVRAKENDIAWQRFSLMDLRAKAATDLDDIETARQLLGHTTQQQTKDYRRGGEVATPITRQKDKVMGKEWESDL